MELILKYSTLWRNAFYGIFNYVAKIFRFKVRKLLTLQENEGPKVPKSNFKATYSLKEINFMT